ncbi:MAG: hypothetical protein MK116_00240 [Phycisphaerales bacterium]|nr:hypothetical protein [Phycisphaerales bacterium]
MNDDTMNMEQQSPARRPRRRMLVAAAVVTATLEVVAAVGLLMLAGPPSGVQADEWSIAEPTPGQQLVEIPLLAERLQNNRAGFTRVYDVEVVLQVRAMDHPRVSSEIARRGNEFRAAVTHLWRSADPAHLDEPDLQTMSRRMKDHMLERFGRDAASGDPIIREVIIISGTGFRAD